MHTEVIVCNVSVVVFLDTVTMFSVLSLLTCYTSTSTYMSVGVAGSVTVTYNAALRRPSFQSSVYSSDGRSYPASSANDGNRDTHAANCSISQRQNNPWWAVDLGVATTVDRVDLTNADDVHGGASACRLSGLMN